MEANIHAGRPRAELPGKFAFYDGLVYPRPDETLKSPAIPEKRYRDMAMEKKGLLSELFDKRELIGNFVSRNLKQRYKGSALGFFWSLLHPLLLVLVYWIFIRLMRFRMDLPYLITGVMVWQFFVLSTSDAVGIIRGHSTLVKKTYFPRIILPLASVLGNLVHFLLSLLVLLAFLLAFQIWPGLQYLHLLWLTVLQSVLCLGMALLVSSLNVFYRDVEHLIQIVLMAWFFVTPVIYPLSKILENPHLPGYALQIYFLNPMAALMELYRQVFLDSPRPGVPVWPGLLIGLGIFVVGYLFFSRLEPRFADEL